MKTLPRVALLVACASTAHANFHVMQIEEVIGGISGDVTAQAIQLRMRIASQGVVNQASIWAWDANGANRVLLLDIAGNVTTNTGAGSRILLATTTFTSTMLAGGATGFSPDFTLANAIPASYLLGGRITFEQDGGNTTTPGIIYWSFSWGNYSGPQTGNSLNDDNGGNFGPAFAGTLKNGTFQGVKFTGAAGNTSTTNAADYALTANPATVTKNTGASFSVVPEPGHAALFALGAAALGAFAYGRRRRAV